MGTDRTIFFTESEAQICENRSHKKAAPADTVPPFTSGSIKSGINRAQNIGGLWHAHTDRELDTIQSLVQKMEESAV